MAHVHGPHVHAPLHTCLAKHSLRSCSVDASPSSVVAYLWLLSSNCRINRHYHGSHHSLRHRTNSPLRAHTPIPDSHSATFVNVAALPKPLTDRVFKTVFTWHFIPPHAYAIAFHPTTDTAAAQIVADDKRASKFIVGEIKGCWYVTRPSSAANTSTLTYIVHGSLNGNIPTAMFKRQVKSTLNECLEVQSRFLRSSTTIDVELRAAFPPPPRLADLTQQQMQVIIGCKLLESQSTLPQSPSNTSRSLFRRPSVAPPPAADAVNQFQPIPSPSPFVQMALKNSTNPTRAIALGRAVAKIDTSPLLAIGEKRRAAPTTRCAWYQVHITLTRSRCSPRLSLCSHMRMICVWALRLTHPFQRTGMNTAPATATERRARNSTPHGSLF